MQNISEIAPSPEHSGDQPQHAEYLLAGLSELAAVLSAGDHPESATLESVRRLGCHLCHEVGQAVCESDSVPSARCPLGLDAIRL